MIFKHTYHFNSIKLEEIMSFIRPSKLTDLVPCYGSFILEDKDAPTNDAAKEGSRLHSVAEDLFKKCFKQKNIIKTPLEKNDYVRKYVNYVFKEALDQLYIKEPCFVGIEIPMKGYFFNYLIAGTSDAVIYGKDKILRIYDLKTGRNMFSEQTWLQLYTYALLAMETFRIKPDKIVLNIYTRYGKALRDVSVEFLLRYKNEVCKRLEEPYFNVGKHCAKCFQFPKCKVVRDFCSKVLTEKDKEKFLTNKEVFFRLINQLNKESRD